VMLDNLDRYIKLKEPTAEIGRKLEKMGLLFSEIGEIKTELINEENEIAIYLTQMNLTWEAHQRRLINWQSKYSARGTGLWDVAINVLGDFFSTEKQAINKLSEEYGDMQAIYNSAVSQFNSKIKHKKMKDDRLLEMILDFINNTLKNEILLQVSILDEQEKKVVQLSSDLESQKNDYSITKKELLLIDKKIFEPFSTSLNALLESRVGVNLSKKYSNFTNLLEDMAKYSPVEEVIDFSKIYSREKIADIFISAGLPSDQNNEVKLDIPFDNRIAQKI